jgi:hypothetical protein
MAVQTRRTPKATCCQLDETCTHLSFQEPFRFPFKKLLHASVGNNACASSPHSHAPQLLDRERSYSLSVNARASCVRNVQRTFFRRPTPYRNRVCPRLAGPAKPARLLTTCAATQTLVSHRSSVKRNVTRARKKIRERDHASPSICRAVPLLPLSSHLHFKTIRIGYVKTSFRRSDLQTAFLQLRFDCRPH